MKKEALLLDKEYVIMSAIEENKSLTQRELSSELGVSVSTVNVLINKMIKAGLIKINHVSKRQVLYMLTPKGIIEKTRKTARYLKSHYRVIFETKEKIKSVLGTLSEKHDVIFILMPEDEMGAIIQIAIDEAIGLNVVQVWDEQIHDLGQYKFPVLLYATLIDEDKDGIFNKLKKVNLIRIL